VSCYCNVNVDCSGPWRSSQQFVARQLEETAPLSLAPRLAASGLQRLLAKADLGEDEMLSVFLAMLERRCRWR